MSFTTPAHTITRWSVVGMEGMFAKMFDPPKDNPDTPDIIAPTNPVPEVMAQFGYQDPPDTAHTMVIQLMHNLKIPTWDNRPNDMMFFLFKNPDLSDANLNDSFPSATVRMPRGVIFHCVTDGSGPPPHTIHWHGMEPTTMNDGVGHCSMEIGRYNYQWQPNFIGSYFAHCHRNTVQHFEFGLYFLLLVEPPDAYFATLANSTIPIGHCRDGKRRIAANLAPTNANPAGFPQFPGWNSNDIADPDPWVPDPNLPWTADARIKFDTDPHANTVPYDVEALWVLDDRDSTWSDLAPDARATFPMQGTRPGFNDNFHNNADVPAAPTDFFAFNDYHADYWYVTGVPVETHDLTPTSIPAGIVIPPGLNSGVSGSQVSINAVVGETILIRCLNAAYNSIKVTLPVDVVVIAWDGRALGVMPYGHNEAYLVPAGTPIYQTTARRFDGLVRATQPINSYATVEFINNRGENISGNEEVVCIARIPMVITAATPATGVTVTPSQPNPHSAGTEVVFTAEGTGSTNYDYRFLLYNGTAWALVQDYGNGDTWTMPATTPTGNYVVAVDVRSNSNVDRDAVAYLSYDLTAGPATGVEVTASEPNPHLAGTAVIITANGQGSANYDYRFNLYNGTNWSLVQDYGNGNVWTLPAEMPVGKYVIAVDVRTSSAVDRDTVTYFNYEITLGPATGVTITPVQPTPHTAGTAVTFTAAGEGSGNYDYRFHLFNGISWSMVQDYGNGNVWTLPAATPVGIYVVAVDVRTSSAVDRDTVAYYNYEITTGPATSVDLTPSQPSPHTAGTDVIFTASGNGSSNYDYRFWLYDGLLWSMMQNYGIGDSWTLPASTPPGDYVIAVDVRTSSAVDRDEVTYLPYKVVP